MLFLWSQNLGETDAAEVVLPLVVLVAVAAGLTWIGGRLLGDRRRAALVVTPLVIGLLMYGHVASYLRDVGVPGIVQQAGWVALVVLATVAALRLSIGTVGTLDTALNRIGALLVGVTLVLIVPFQTGAVLGRTSLETTEVRPDTTTARKRDVYWLIFDRYGSDRGLEIQYGVRNDLTLWLTEHGFEVLPDSHANYVSTALSLSSTLQMRHHDELAAQQGPDSADKQPIYDRLQSSPVARQFKEMGYRYLHLGSWWDPTRDDAAADRNLLPPGPSDFVAALSDTSALPAIARRLGIPSEQSRERAYRYNTYALDTLDALRDEPGPKFVMGHVLLPHPPVVFDRDGTFMTVDETREMPSGEPYRRQLEYTNTRLRALIEDLLARPPDEQPIIILQGDEGPWPPEYSQDRAYDWLATSEDVLESKFGILNAWYVPGGTADLGLEPDQTAINTFPKLFDGYFGLDYETLPDRVTSSRAWTRPYDLTDITDRLPSLRD